MTKRYEFPKGFLFGAATASYQIEGAIEADGRQPSVWDTFCTVPGKISDASSGKDACRSYDLWKTDLDLFEAMHLNSYRFSIAWPRVIPGGTGAVNTKGMDFYDKLVDGLLKRGIKPNVTLYHWDLPQSLEDKDGWLNRDTAYAYADYAAVVVKKLGDRVALWATHNEPQVFVGLGYHTGVHAPGRKESEQKVSQATHHVLLSHGLGMKAIRANAKKAGVQAGIVLAPAAIWPQTAAAADVAAAELHWQDTNDWWVLPMMKGHYPQDAWKRRGANVPVMEPGDMELIHQPMDFLGLNYYCPGRTVASESQPGYIRVNPAPDAPMTSMPHWEIFAPGIENLLVQFSRRYPKIDLYITENGMSISGDTVGEDGQVHDPVRLAFVRDHLIHCLRAMEQGAPLKGYFVWSAMDNFEWGHGYTQRFGLAHVDYKTFKRTLKDSGQWYAAAALEGGFEGPELPDIKSGFGNRAKVG